MKMSLRNTLFALFIPFYWYSTPLDILASESMVEANMLKIQALEKEAFEKHPELATTRRYPNFKVEVGYQNNREAVEAYYRHEVKLKHIHSKVYTIIDILGDKPVAFIADTEGKGELVSRATDTQLTAYLLAVYEYISVYGLSSYFAVIYQEAERKDVHEPS